MIKDMRLAPSFSFYCGEWIIHWSRATDMPRGYYLHHLLEEAL